MWFSNLHWGQFMPNYFFENMEAIWKSKMNKMKGRSDYITVFKNKIKN